MVAPRLMVYLLVLGAPLALGGALVHYEVRLVLRLLVAITLVLYWLYLKRTPDSVGVPVVTLVAVGVVVGIGILQVLPLPHGLAELVAPLATKLRDAVYPLVLDNAPYPITPDYGWTANALGMWFEAVAALLLGAGLFSSRNDMKQLLSVLVLSAGLVVVVGLVHLLAGIDKLYGVFEWWPASKRFSFGSTLRNDNNLAAFLGMGSLAAAGVAMLNWSEESKRQTWLIGAALLGFFSIISLSRGAILVYVATLPLLFLIDSQRPQRRRSLKLWYLLPLFAVAAAALFAAPMLNREIASTVELLPTLSIGKFKLWKGFLSLLRDHPIFGAGLGALPVFSVYLLGVRAISTEMMPYHWAVEAGIPAATGLLVAIGYLLVRSFKRNNRTWVKLVGLILLFLLVHNLFDYNLTLTAVGFPFFLMLGGLELALARQDKARSRKTLSGRLAFVAAGLLVIVGIFAYLYSPKRDYKKMYELASSTISEAEFVKRSSAILKRHPLDAHMYDLAAAYYLKPKNPEALKRRALLLEKALLLAPYSATLHERLALTYLRLGRLDQAKFHVLEALEKADARNGREFLRTMLDLDPDPDFLWSAIPKRETYVGMLIGHVLFAKKDYEAAAKLIQRAKPLFGKAPFLVMLEANLKARTGKSDELRPMLEAAEREVMRTGTNEQIAGVLFYAAIFYRHLGEIDAAVERFEKAVRLRPTNFKFWNEYVRTLIRANRYDEAEAVLHRAKTAAPRYKVQFFLLEGDLFRAEGEFVKAAKRYEQALLASRNRSVRWQREALERLVSLYLSIKDPERASRYLSQLSKLDPSSKRVRTFRERLKKLKHEQEELRRRLPPPGTGIPFLPP